MSIARPTASFDAQGRAIPLSEEEIRRRNEQAIRALDALDDMGDEDEQRETLEFLIKAIDEDRLSKRRRFR
jgi:hypothetical protein